MVVVLFVVDLEDLVVDVVVDSVVDVVVDIFVDVVVVAVVVLDFWTSSPAAAPW